MPIKTYLRILAYAGPLRKLSLFYFLTTLLATFFGLANLSLLIPLLKVLFSQTVFNDTLTIAQKPTVSISLSYLKDIFNYQFIKIIATYGKITTLYCICIVIVLSILFTNLFRYLAELIMAKIRTNLIYNLRNALFDKTVYLDLAYFTKQHKGDLIARITSDVQEVEHAIADSLRVCFKDPTTIISFLIVLFYMSTKLTLFAFLFLPIAGTIMVKIIRRLRKWAHQSQASLGRIMHILEETMSGIRIIKVFSAQSYAFNKFKQENDAYGKISMNLAYKQGLAASISELLGVSVVAIILAYGGKLVLLGESSLSASTFITYIIIFSQALIPIKAASKALGNIQRGLAAGKRILTLIDTKPAVTNLRHPRKIKTLKQLITFKEVGFTYDEKPILKQLNFSIAKGKMVALVGSSGGGKSTIVDLIGRLYNLTAGEIQIDGIPLHHYDIHSLNKMIGTVTQEPILFHDTVFNNIAFGRLVAKKAVIKAAQVAHAHAFIMELPQGYQTVIGAQGTKLSSGQKQRLTIARAVVGNPSILILDEATSALDSASEQLIQEALQNLIQNKTVIVIAHRLSTIQNADEIIVIEDGTIVEQGTHQILMQKNGLYKKLNMMQQIQAR